MKIKIKKIAWWFLFVIIIFLIGINIYYGIVLQKLINADSFFEKLKVVGDYHLSNKLELSFNTLIVATILLIVILANMVITMFKKYEKNKFKKSWEK